MRKPILWMLTVLLVLSSVPGSGQTSQPPAKFVPARVLVKFRAQTRPAAIQAAHLAVAAEVVTRFKSVAGLQLVRIPASSKLSQALAAYRSNPDVQYAEPDYIVHAFQTPTDPLFSNMWSLLNSGQSGGTIGADIKATQAWDITTGSPNVIIAVIDSGVDYNHPDLAGNIFTGPICPGGVICHGITAITGSVIDPNDPFDDNGHGTHVSGTIGAAGNNSLGVTGINWNVSILPCKFLNSEGIGSTSDAIQCLDFIKGLKDQGLNIVATNNSWGGTDFSQALEDAIDRQRQSGILFIAAAGNDFADNDLVPTYPASFPLPNIISVAATDRNDKRAFFSNVGRHTVHLGAPGQDILSTLPGGTYGIESGTSMATPHVTGVAALLAAQDPTRDWRAIKNLILAGGDPDPNLAATISGRRLDAFAAMTCANSPVSGRLAPVTDVTSASVGVPLTLSALNINCAQPAGPVQVTVSPGGQTITLSDDGVAPDASAADGIYTGSFTPAAPGVYTLAFSTGDTLTVQVLNNYQATDDSSAFNYRTITGTNLNLGDDEVAQIASPFPISFGNGSFTQLWISANGTISFSDAFSSYVHEFMPTGAPGSLATVPATTLVAPFWDDLFPVKGTAQNIFWEVTGTAPNRELVVEWRDVKTFECSTEPDTIKFQVVFFENSSDVLFNYADAEFGGSCIDHDRGSSATIGLQVAPQLGGLWGFNGQTVNAGTSILWQVSAAAPPAPLVPTVTSLSPSAVDAYGPDFTVTVTGSNFQPGARVQNGLFDRVTTFISSTQLSVLIPASDIDLFRVFRNGLNLGVRNPGSFFADITTELPLAINNPAHPVITGFSPASAPGNGVSFLLDISGNDFGLSPSVIWNGQTLQFASALSRTEIQAIVPGTLAFPGTAQVQVVNPAPGGGSSPLASYLLGPPAPAVAPTTLNAFINNAPHPAFGSSPATTAHANPPLKFPGWNYARQLGDAYFNHFIRPYAPAFIATAPGKASPAGSASLAASLSGSLPGIGVNSATPTGFLPTSVAVGDFNRDGHPDYVISNGGSNDLWIYFGNGDGTFQNPRIIPLNGVSPVQVIAADLRGLGILDLIVGEPDSLSVGVLLGNGDGTFGPETLYFSPGPPFSIAVADFNGDGHPDVVAGILGTNATGALAFFAGDGAGHLAAPLFTPASTFFEVPFVSLQMSVADFNKDGLPDLIVTDVGDLSPGVLFYQNQGNGTFKAKPQLLFSNPDVNFFYVNTAAGDLNHDGCPDLVADDTFGLTTVVMGNCDGTFRDAPVRFASGDISASVTMADVNGDGNLDVIIGGAPLLGSPPGGQSGNLLAISLGDGTGALLPPHVIRVQAGLFAVAAADLNGDLKPDIIAASQDADSVTTLINDGLGHFPGPQGGYAGYFEVDGPVAGGINAPTASYVADLNGDGKPDLFFADFGLTSGLPANISVALNDGTGGFGRDIKSPILDAPVFFGNMIAGDFRNTGKADLIVVPDQFDQSFSGPFYNFVAGVGDGHFNPPTRVTMTHPTGTLAAGDFNGDGKLDFVMFGFSGLSTFLGNGDGTFVEGPLLPFPTFPPGAIFVADVNGDGKLDLLVPLTGALVEFLGHGDGTFAPGVPAIGNLSTGSSITSGIFGVADLNHDGRADVVLRTAQASSPFPPLFQVYLAQPDGTLLLTNTYTPYSGTALIPVNGQNQFTSSFLADFNGDGNADIASFQTDRLTGNYVQIMLGNGDGSFTPTFEKLPLGIRGFMLPTLNADVNGDGKADFLELDAFTSVFNVINSSVGHPFQIQFSALPIVGPTAAVQVSLSAAAAQDTVLQLSSSDPGITVPPTLTVAAGSLSASATLTVSPAFDPSRTFTVTATDGLNSSSALASVAIPGKAVGFLTTAGTQLFEALLPGQSSGDIGFGLSSRGGYQTTVNAHCEGLPAGVTCQFGNATLQLPPGGFVSTPLTLAVSSVLAVGDYTFSVVASDVAISQSVPVTFHVGDFAMQLTSQSVAALSTGFENFQLSATSVNHFVGAVNLTCSGLPAGASCLLSNTIVGAGLGGPSDAGVGVNTSGLAVGDYPFVITGDTGFTQHSVNAILHVGDFGGGSVTPSSATLNVGQSATFNLTVASVNGFGGNVELFCSPTINNVTVNGISCSFSPVPATFDSTGKLSAQITVTATAHPRGANVRQGASTASSRRWYGGIAALLLVAVVLAASPRKRKGTFGLCCIAILALAVIAACGGSGSSGNHAPPIPTPTPAPPQTVNVDVMGISQEQFQAPSKKLATFSVTVQ